MSVSYLFRLLERKLAISTYNLIIKSRVQIPILIVQITLNKIDDYLQDYSQRLAYCTMLKLGSLQMRGY